MRGSQRGANTKARSPGLHPAVVAYATKAGLTAPHGHVAPIAAKPRCIWLTGLSGAGKTTIAKALEVELMSAGVRTHVLDGDEVRKALSRDLGYGAADRSENIRRISEVARLLVNDGFVVIVACISPFEADRRAARQRFNDGQFFEVFVDTPLDICETRDCKGLYKKARAGLIPEFTGVSSPYERPSDAELEVVSTGATPRDIARTVMVAVGFR